MLSAVRRGVLRAFSNAVVDVFSPTGGLTAKLVVQGTRRLCHVSAGPIQNGVCFRRATAEDYQGIVELSKQALRDRYVTDYIPGNYHKYLADLYRRLYVATKDGQVIAFYMNHVIDDGANLQGEAGRTLPGYQGKGLFSRLMEYATTDLPNTWSGYRAMRASTTRPGFFKADENNVLSKRMAFRLEFASGKEIIGPEGNTRGALCRMSMEQLRSAVADPYVKARLFPDDLLICNHMVYSALPCNIALLHRYSEVILTDSTGATTFDGPNHVVPTLSLSVGGRTPCDDSRAWRYDFNYYGDADLDLLLTHMRRHLREGFLPPRKDKVYFIVMIPLAFCNRHTEEDLVTHFENSFRCARSSTTVMYQYAYDYVHLAGSGVRNAPGLSNDAQ